MATKPGNVQTIGILMLISGVLNILAGITITVLIVLGTLFIGIICVPITLIPIGIGVYEIVVGANILNNKPAKTITVVAGLEIASILWANFISMTVGILVLVFYNDPATKAYLEDVKTDTISMDG
jgi:hypothetical protein